MAATTAAVIGAAAAVGGVISSNKNAGKAADAQGKQNKRNEAFIREQAAKARKDILPLFGAGQDARSTGAQAALNIFGQSIPQQASQFQRGNVGAQQALLAGLPQVQNALLGLPTDLSGLQPQQIQFDNSFAQQQVPQFVTGQEALDVAEGEQFAEAQQGIKTNADLFRAAAAGEIPGLSPQDQAFFQAHLVNVLKQPDRGQGTSFVGVGDADIANVVGNTTFNAENQAALDRLLRGFSTASGGQGVTFDRRPQDAQQPALDPRVAQQLQALVGRGGF